jgi:hypothetical protein
VASCKQTRREQLGRTGVVAGHLDGMQVVAVTIEQDHGALAHACPCQIAVRQAHAGHHAIDAKRQRLVECPAALAFALTGEQQGL